MNPSASSLFTVFAAVVVLGAGFCSSESCFPKFKNTEAYQTAGANCVKALAAQGVNMNNMTAAGSVEGKKHHWNDNCLANCTLVELKVIVDNEFKKDVMVAFLKESAPADALDKLTKIVDECEAISFKHSHDHGADHGKKEHGDKKAVVQGKEDKMEKAPTADGNKMGKPASATKSENNAKDDGKDNVHHHDHSKMICHQAAKFSACYKEREQEVC